jgi:hypothetical protein
MNAKSLRYRDYLEHMLDAIRLARGYVDGLTKEISWPTRRPSRRLSSIS